MRFLLLAFLAASPALADEAERTRVYRVRQTATLDQIEKGTGLVRWWVSIPDDSRFQDVLDFRVVSAPGDWGIVRDLDRANRFLFVEVRDPQADSLDVVCEFTLRRRPVRVAIDAGRGGEVDPRVFPEELRKDSPHMEVTDAIEARAAKICGLEGDVARQARMLLDHVADVADHYSKDPTKPNCGIGDAGACIEQGGGCCTDMHSLFIALARSRGIPARLQMGYRMLQKNVGKEVDPGYRCWVEYFVPGYGWVPTDIVEADATKGLGRDRWFTGLTEERLWLNSGRDFRFQGARGIANHMSLGYAELDGVAARVLPEGEKKPQLTRKVRFEEVGRDG